MTQILNIFWKDCRKFWPEILLSLAVTAAFVAMWPYVWSGWHDVPEGRGLFLLDQSKLRTIAGVAMGLMPISWLILIARVVHDENLLGNRQFWVTRPYRWHLLLLEKVLFIVVFVCLPFSASQAVLLMRAGFSWSAYLPNLAFELMLMAAIVIVPLFALAVVTSSLLRVVGTLVTAIALIGIVAFFANDHIASTSSISIPHSDHVAVPLVFLCGAAIALLQYAKRKVWLSRTLLAAAVMMVVGDATGPFDHMIFEREYQPRQGNWTGSEGIALTPGSRDKVQAFRSDGTHVGLRIPLTASGLAEGEELIPDDFSLTIEAGDGSKWTSPWESIFGRRFLADSADSFVYVRVDSKFYELARRARVTIHLSFAFTKLQAGKPEQAVYRVGHDLEVPEIGICRAFSLESPNFSCLSALREPAGTRLTASIETFCDERLVREPHLVSDWVGSADPAPAQAGLTSVWSTSIALRSGDDGRTCGKGEYMEERIRDQTPIVVTPFNVVTRYKDHIGLTDVELPESAVENPDTDE